MVLFARDDIHHIQDTELKLLYAILKKIRIPPVQELVKRWLNTFSTTTPIMCSSLITRHAASVDALDGPNAIYIATPRIFVNEAYLIQAHNLKHGNIRNELVYFFPGYTNEIPLPNQDLRLYMSQSLTFTLVEKEEARRSYVSCRPSQRRTRQDKTPA